MSSETPVIVVDGAEEPGKEYVTPFRCTDLDSWFVIVRQRTTLTWDFAPADGAASDRYSAFPDSDGSTEIVRFGALMCASHRCGGMQSARGAPPEGGSSDGSGRARVRRPEPSSAPASRRWGWSRSELPAEASALRGP